MAQQKTTRNIEILQGATFKLTLRFRDSLGLNLINVGDTARMQIRAEKSQTAPLILDCAAYISIVSGVIFLEIPATVTAGLTFEAAYYDIELVQGSAVRRLSQGTVALDKGVTA